jgi:hypothetical protein
MMKTTGEQEPPETALKLLLCSTASYFFLRRPSAKGRARLTGESEALRHSSSTTRIDRYGLE